MSLYAKKVIQPRERQGLSMDKVKKTEQQWREQLGDFAYHVCREKGTERAFTGEYWDTKTKGIYHCRGCNVPLFSSDTKYDSGSGWPSFYQPVDAESVMELSDDSLSMHRVEAACVRCQCHLGHVFTDGPKPTGLRYCINAASLMLVPEKSRGEK